MFGAHRFDGGKRKGPTRERKTVPHDASSVPHDLCPSRQPGDHCLKLIECLNASALNGENKRLRSTVSEDDYGRGSVILPGGPHPNTVVAINRVRFR
jgi:hypothetical protein